jgi:hypothetical protein
MEQCGYSGHLKKVNYVCCSNMTKRSNKDCVVLEDMVFCTIEHQKDYAKKSTSYNLTWSNDGADGKDYPRSSELYLIEYLNIDENFANWCHLAGQEKKLELAANIACNIFAKGVKVKCTSEQIKSKIEWIEAAMRSAYDFSTSETGEGIKEIEGYESFAEKVIIKSCQQFNVSVDSLIFSILITGYSNMPFL